MTLLTILIVLVLQRYLGVGDMLHRAPWCERYVHIMKPLIDKIGYKHEWFVFFALLLPIPIIIGLLALLFSTFFFGILTLLLNIAVLLVAMNARDLKVYLSNYLTAYANKDMVLAQQEAEKLIGTSVPKEVAPMSRAITHAIFERSLVQIFSVLFWFILLGAFGASLYFLTTLIRTHAEKGDYGLGELAKVSEDFHDLLDWIPVRLLGLTFALVGHFSSAFSRWLDTLFVGIKHSSELATEYGLAALSPEALDMAHADLTENYQALDLITRSLITWVIVVAVLSVAWWL